MADVNTQAQEVQTQQEPENQQTETQQTAPEDFAKQMEEMNLKLQEALTEAAKQKRAADKASAEAADFKKKYRESLSTTEQATMEKAEREAAEEERVKALERKVAIYEATESFLDEKFPVELAKKAAIAEVDGDKDTLHEIRKQAKEAERKSWEAEFLKTLPEVNIGGSGGQSYTKEQFDAMGPIERTKLYNENKAEYDRLMAL